MGNSDFDNALIISQARLGSTRLKDKVLLSADNRTLIEHHIARLKQSGVPICIATTLTENDKVLCEFLTARKIDVFRGDEHDVLSRFYHCAKAHNAQLIIRVTSDCPLIDGDLIAQAVRKYREIGDQLIYISNVENRTYPRGFDFEVFSFALLEEAFLHAKEPEQREHVSVYIRNICQQRRKNIDITRADDASNFRVTVDTDSDYQLVKRLIEDFDCINQSAEDIISLMRSRPELGEINKHIEQTKVRGAT